ncbi:MAG: hypothetical protein PHY02_04510 [Phycisphaerae bacterium]|nr:hypothetical protein [Phycisphaerae bacterium]
MSKKDSNFFEEHVEKIVLVVVGLVCFWLFITRVLFSPNYVKYDNDKFDAGSIDNHISKQTDALEMRLNRKPEPGQPYQPQADKFIALLDSAISDIDIGLSLPQPVISSRGISDNKAYRIPLIGEVNEVSVEHIRAVAYVPKEEAGTENVYDQSNSEPNDIDFVTVEAKFNVSGLYKRFHECFAGEHIPQDWRNRRLANPVFAAVQLQRQKLLSDGSWSDWQTVPRSKIDPRKEMFKIVEYVNDLPAGGVKVRILQFDDAKVKMDLLQPDAYQIASAKEEWFPPSLHRKYTDYQRERNVIERREAAAEKREEREGKRPERQGRTTPTDTRSATSGRTPTESRGERGAAPVTARRTPSRKTERDLGNERPQKGKEVSITIEDIYQGFNEISITESTDFTGMDEPLLFWAHDDTAEPGESYRYRIRLGVFNPIAGTNQFGEQDKSLKNKVVLWSKFSDTTETVNIPETLYIFPRDVQEATMTVTVQVSKYVLGYWYSKDFMVKQGEVIGEAGEYKITEDEEQRAVTVPKTVNYATGAVLVDIVPVNDWSGGNNLHARHFLDMLYSFDGKNIEHLPTKTRYWAESLLSKFNEIKRAEKEPKEPLRGWEGQAGQRLYSPVQDERRDESDPRSRF